MAKVTPQSGRRLLQCHACLRQMFDDCCVEHKGYQIESLLILIDFVLVFSF